MLLTASRDEKTRRADPTGWLQTHFRLEILEFNTSYAISKWRWKPSDLRFLRPEAVSPSFVTGGPILLARALQPRNRRTLQSRTVWRNELWRHSRTSNAWLTVAS